MYYIIYNYGLISPRNTIPKKANRVEEEMKSSIWPRMEERI